MESVSEKGSRQKFARRWCMSSAETNGLKLCTWKRRQLHKVSTQLAIATAVYPYSSKTGPPTHAQSTPVRRNRLWTKIRVNCDQPLVFFVCLTRALANRRSNSVSCVAELPTER